MGGAGGRSHQTHISLLVTLLFILTVFSFISPGVQCVRSVLQAGEGDSQLGEKGSDLQSDDREESESHSGDDSYTQVHVEEKEPRIAHPDFTLGVKISDWDQQRAQWLQQNPGLRLNKEGNPRITLVTSSRSGPCPSPAGDHYLLKFLKNKMDYVRLHDIEIFYNLAVLEEKMTGFFIKLPILRNIMLTHPEVEWIWWMDSDALFTDMSFEIPLEKYKDYNMVVPGWEHLIYENKSWIGLNAGIFLLRNCQWSLDLIDLWASFGEDFEDNKEQAGALVSKALPGRPDFGVDDQSALVYLLAITHTAQLRPKVFVEESFDLHGYWPRSMEKMEAKLKDFPGSKPGGRMSEWSFITHFVGCKTCTGAFASYRLEDCLGKMERAFNLADNQVLSAFGFEHEDLSSAYVIKNPGTM